MFMLSCLFLAFKSYSHINVASKDHSGSAEFRRFCHQLFHSSLEHVLSSLRPHMTTPQVTLCPEGHYCRVVYGPSPYIADYPEQALLTCIAQKLTELVSAPLTFAMVLQIWSNNRCTALADDLDGPAGQCSHEHTDSFSDGCTLKELWDDYGIIADLQVHCIWLAHLFQLSIFYSHSLHHSLVLTFTN